MKAPAPYDVIAPISKMAAFHSARKSERKQLIEFFEQLAKHPATESTWTVKDSAGRVNFQAQAGRFLVTYWPDHAAREVRIVKIVRLE